MTAQDLIDRLEALEDKSLEVLVLDDDYGLDTFSSVATRPVGSVAAHRTYLLSEEVENDVSTRGFILLGEKFNCGCEQST